MHIASYSLVLAFLASYAAAFIVPEELVSFLSIVYSNIPPIRKGTDSRVGVGFRLGPHADAQIILELGPQQATRPIGPNADTRKRHTALNGLQANDWLTSWRTSVAHRLPPAERPALSAEDDGGRDNDPVPFPDPTRLAGEPVVSHLRQLYRKDPKKASLATSSEPLKPTWGKSITKPPKEDLSDVTLDD